jgi:DNA-binding XRE family transcriptional regulator
MTQKERTPTLGSIGLKAWREEQGISQAEASRRVGVSAASWCDWEGHKKTPDLKGVADIEKLTDGAVVLAHWLTPVDGEQVEPAAGAA